MQKEINISEIKDKLYSKLQSSGWGLKLRSFIYSGDFDKIIISLLDNVNNNKRFTPPLKQVFRAFEECPYDKLKVVIIGQDPYPGLGIADGISFSCSNTGKLQPSLKFILEEVDRTVYQNHVISEDLDLKRWSNQGILMLNTALTTEIGKVGAHYDIWEPFVVYLLDHLKNFHPGIIYVFMGKKSQEWAELCGENCTKLMVSHPASAVYQKNQKWDSKDIFNTITTLVKELYNEEIIW